MELGRLTRFVARMALAKVDKFALIPMIREEPVVKALAPHALAIAEVPRKLVEMVIRPMLPRVAPTVETSVVR